ncbi:NAD(P)-binding protein [Paraliobacillus sediminis]|uniref:NAD(P)-binding protein n=1 Tax=Paraliobacillus sediminis TaxID=1885916 RepID=UPI000E3C0479|nr:NAD(P)-binding protein [Paraliobacillus sediminis]
MMASIPMMIDVKGQKVVVVGGGKIAQRRITTLLDTDAIISVISPTVTKTIESLHIQKSVYWQEKVFEESDLDHAFLIIVATNNSAINHWVIESAPKNALINAVEDATQGNVQFPIHLKRGKLSIAISTTGASPAFAKKIKHELENEYDERYQAYMDFLFDARQLVKTANIDSNEKKKILHSLINEELLDSHLQKKTLHSLRIELHKKASE